MPDRFPDVRGRNLDHKRFKLPTDLEGEQNILVCAFLRDQQREVNTWAATLEDVAEKYRSVRWYEVPVLSTGYLPLRLVIDGGMRAGIPDPAARHRTITVYTSKTRFKAALDIEDGSSIRLYLVDRHGSIHWSAKGGYDPEPLAELERVLSAQADR